MERKLRGHLVGGTAPALGIVLVLGGVVLLAAQYVSIDLGHYGWPVFVIGPGVVLVLLGLLSAEASRLVLPGMITLVTGLLLAVQNTFDLWATWAYAWAIVFPGAVGLAMVLEGGARGNLRQVRDGTRMALAGLVLFAVLGVVFEGILNLSGLALGAFGRIGLPLVLIGAGVVMLVVWALNARDGSAPQRTT